MPVLQRIGIQLYDRQLPPDSCLAYGEGGGLMDLPFDRLGTDFLLLGGRSPDEGRTGGGSAVPAFAGALCVSAAGQGIVTRLDPWCFGPAHVARIGANLDRLSGGRWRLLLDFSDPFYAATAPAAAELPLIAVEMIDAVRAHWRGAADFSGRYYRTQGRIVGPRPEYELPPILLKLPSTVGQVGQELGDRIDGMLIAAPCGLARVVEPRLLEAAVVIRESRRAAEAAAGALAVSVAAPPVLGTAEAVAEELAARCAAVGAAELIVSFPAMSGAEIRAFAEMVLPQLRSAAAVET